MSEKTGVDPTPGNVIIRQEAPSGVVAEGAAKHSRFFVVEVHGQGQHPEDDERKQIKAGVELVLGPGTQTVHFPALHPGFDMIKEEMIMGVVHPAEAN